MDNMKKTYAVFLGRFCPIHLGHQVVIDKMISTYGIKNCFLFIGSSNQPMSLRNFFSFRQRFEYIYTLYPDLKVSSLPDYTDNEQWILDLTLQLNLAGIKINDVDFFGGSYEDISFFEDLGYSCNYVNRYDDKVTKKISASEVRQALIDKTGTTMYLLDPRINTKVAQDFHHNWTIFSKR